MVDKGSLALRFLIYVLLLLFSRLSNSIFVCSCMFSKHLISLFLAENKSFILPKWCHDDGVVFVGSNAGTFRHFFQYIPFIKSV